MGKKYCTICKARLTENNYSNYCGIHTVDSSIAIVLQQGEIAVKTSKIDAVIDFADNYQSESTHDRKHINKIIEMLEELKKKG